MEILYIFILGISGGILLPLMVGFFVDFFSKKVRILPLVGASIGAILGILVGVIGMIAPLQFLQRIPLHENFIFYMIGLAVGVLFYRLILKKWFEARNRSL